MIPFVEAYLSPSTIQILSGAVGGWLQAIIVFLITFIVTLGLKIKKKRTKKIFIALGIILLIIVSIIVFYRYNKISKINKKTINVEDISKLNAIELEDYEIIFDENFAKERKLDIDDIKPEDYEEYRIIVLAWHLQNEFKIKDALYMDFITLWESIRQDLFVDTKIKSINISKESKIILFCNHGWASQIVAYKLYELGYDAYYSSFNDISNSQYLEHTQMDIKGHSPILIKETKINEINKGDYTYFLFNIQEEYTVCNNNIEIFKSIQPIEASRFGKITLNTMCENIKIGEITQLDHKKLLCFSDLHCLLSQHFIAHIGKSKKINTIYRLK